MGDCIHLNVGQAGVRIGDLVCQQYCTEHGLNPDGSIDDDSVINTNKDAICSNGFFKLRPKTKRYTPKAIFVDPDPGEIDIIRTGKYRSLYLDDCLLSGRAESSCTYSRGYYNIDQGLIDDTLGAVRKVAEKSDTFQGLHLTHSQGGGTGSGLSGLLLDHLCADFPKSVKFRYSVFPTYRFCSDVVEPYNTVLSTHDLLQTTDLAFLMDNEAGASLCASQLKLPKPFIQDINIVMKHVVANVTAMLRFPGGINRRMTEYLTNLVPAPRIHFPVVASSPLVHYIYDHRTIKSLSENCFNPSNQIMTSSKGFGKFMGCCINLFGSVTQYDVVTSVEVIKNLPGVSFVPWCPPAFKVGLSAVPPTSTLPQNLKTMVPKKCMFAMSNTTAVSSSFRNILNKYNKLFSKRSYLHWYTVDGMDELQFIEARENIQALLEDYSVIQYLEPIGNDTKIKDNETTITDNEEIPEDDIRKMTDDKLAVEEIKAMLDINDEMITDIKDTLDNSADAIMSNKEVIAA